jgi:general secretion pathway protein K
VTGRGDRGFAIVAAIAALALFAAVAFAVLAAGKGNSADLAADVVHARLEAAADAGLALAIDGLALEDPDRRWPLAGTRTLVFDGLQLTVKVEDERGKVPIGAMDEVQARRLFEAAGVRGEALDALTDAFLDWLDDDEEPRRHGAETEPYAALGLSPRNGAPVTLDELSRVKGMTPAVLARIRPVLTNYFGLSGGFDRRTATPEAVAVATGGGLDSVQAIERRRELDGQAPVIDIASDQSLAGRSVTVAVQAADGRGGRFARRTVVTFTGKPSPAYYVREVN